MDFTQCSLMSLYMRYPSFARTLTEHVGSQMHCVMVNQRMGEALTAVMGVMPGRSGRHASYNCRGDDVVVKSVDPFGPRTGAARFEAWPIGHPGVDVTGVCVSFPTKESLLRNAGETRGLLVMLAQ